MTATLAGRTPGVHLADAGRAQAAALAMRLSALPVVAVVSSPLERCIETAEPIGAACSARVETDDRLLECDYGDWTGRPLAELGKEPAWRVVQDHASAAAFPGGESLRAMQHRAVEAVRDWNSRLTAPPDPADGTATVKGGASDENRRPSGVVWVAVTHGDVIKAVLADALGMHLDAFQRIVVDVASVSAVHYTPLRPFVSRVNDRGGTDDDLRPSAADGSSDAVVGGPTGGTDAAGDVVGSSAGQAT